MPISIPKPARVAAVLALLAGLTACTGAAGSTPSWQPQPDFQGNNDPKPQLPNPQLPNPGIATPSLPGNAIPGPTPSGPSGSAPSSPAGTDPNVVATKLVEPTGLVVLPDGTALVGERKSGKIYRVQPTAGTPAKLVQQLAGVDGSGDGGLLDLAISPTYDQDGLIYAYLSTAADNRVVHFPLGSVPSVVIGGIPKGRTGNAGRIVFDATGALLTGTGDAGQPSLATNPTSLAGKILRTDDIGKPQPDNPVASSPIYARGFSAASGISGLCVDRQSGLRLAVSGDRVFTIKAGANVSGASASATLPAALAGGGGCAVGAGQLAVASATGKALAISQLGKDGKFGSFTASLAGAYGRLRTVVAGNDGALWLTTRNRDGFGKPVADDDRVIRITNPDSTSPTV